MGKFLTADSRIRQLAIKGMYELLDNELYEDDDGSIYLAWRGVQTDNFTWINSSDYDIRCAHQHDIGCLYHQVVKVNLSESELRLKKLLRPHKDKVTGATIMVCENIPIKYLEVVNVSGHWINNFFYRCLKAADCPKTPKFIQCAYRAGVCFNVGWFKSGKVKIHLEELYRG